MSALNWTSLRPWGGSQHGAFEELCCQLAAHEPVPPGAEYRRLGAPDAGVECVWCDPSGHVRAWQAKFFLKPPSASEWQQIDESVSQALEHYPELASYTLCLPIDRPDARIAGQQSMMDRWNARVAQWTADAEAVGVTVAFHYWGEHEIAERLARAEHAGRSYFWFSTAVLGPDWFRECFRVARENAGPRYSPEIHVGVPISDVFDALARHPRFAARIRRQWGVVRREAARALPSRTHDTAPVISDSITSSTSNGRAHDATQPGDSGNGDDHGASAAADRVEVAATRVRVVLDHVGRLVPQVQGSPARPLPLAQLDSEAEALREGLTELSAAFDAVEVAVMARKAKQAGATPDSSRSGGRSSDVSSHRHAYEHERHAAWRAAAELRDFRTLLTDEGAHVANTSGLLVTGAAGTGKTHLFCDVAERTIRDGEPCVLLLGEHFVRGDPWRQIIHQLQLDCPTPDHLLGGLSAAAEAAGRRTLLLIDAVNEGDGRCLWRDHLSGVLATIQRYPWIAVALSVRSSYEAIVIPEAARARLTRIEHHGFADREVAATRRFFDAHGIERPSVPLLTPEFSNPLFLKLFCRGIRNRGLRRVPPGLEGISAIFSFFLDSVHERLAKPERLDFDIHVPVVERAVSVLASEMVATGSQWVARERAAALLDDVLPSRGGFERSLLSGLLSEGILSEELVWTGPERQMLDAVRFTYERLADHRIARLLLDAALAPDGSIGSAPCALDTPAAPEAASADGSRHTGDAVADPDGRSGDDTDGESLSERADAGHGRGPADSAAAGPPLLSLSTLFTGDSAEWYYHGIISALAIQVPERTGLELWELWSDARASSVVAEAFFDSLQWRRPDAIRQTALRVVDRHLRTRTPTGDRVRDLLIATTARPGHPLNAELLDRVLRPGPMPERDVWWSTYAAQQDGGGTPLGRLIDWAWRAGRERHHSEQAVELAGVTLAWTLTVSNRKVRDHATKALVSLLRGRPAILRRLLGRFQDVDDAYVAERLHAVAYGCALRGIPPAELEALAREVFKRTFAGGSPPAHLLLRDYARGIIETAAAWGLVADLDLALVRPPYRSDAPGEAPTETELRDTYYAPYEAGKEEGYFSLWFSLLSRGDFARYIVGTNSHSFDWSARPLSEAFVPTRRQRHDAFFDALSDSLRQRWYAILGSVARLRDLTGKKLDLPSAQSILITHELVEGYLSGETARFRRRLSRSQRPEFDEVKNWANEPREPHQFDLEYALRWLFQRVIALGWTPERFNWFDSHLGYDDGRMSHHSERIGKKYQWIAFHEFTARVSDRFEFIGDRWSNEPQQYHGPWQLYRRDIDPSYLGRGGPGLQADSRNAWWQPVRCGDLRREADDASWIVATEDLPALGGLVAPQDPQDGTRWLWLRGDAEWREPEPPEELPYERARRSMRYWITGYIVKHADRDTLVRWASGRDLWDLRLHETISTTQVFMGEYSWAPAFVTQYPQVISDPWTRLDGGLPVQVVRPAVRFHWESSGYDESVEYALNPFVPAPALLGNRTGSWRRPRASADFTNPSLIIRGPNTLLARESSLRVLLRRRQWDIVWLMTGEKILIGGGFAANDEDWVGRLELSGVGLYTRAVWHERCVAFLNRGDGKRTRL